MTYKYKCAVLVDGAYASIEIKTSIRCGVGAIIRLKQNQSVKCQRKSRRLSIRLLSRQKDMQREVVVWYAMSHFTSQLLLLIHLTKRQSKRSCDSTHLINATFVLLPQSYSQRIQSRVHRIHQKHVSNIIMHNNNANYVAFHHFRPSLSRNYEGN